MPDKLALLPREYILGDVALAIVPKRSEQPQRDIKAVARDWLTPLWGDYWFQLQRHFLQQQVIPEAARRFPLTILVNGILQPAPLANPSQKLIWSLAQRIADPERERSLVGVGAYPDGSRRPSHVTSAARFAPYSATIIASTGPVLRALDPAPSDYRERLWTAIALLQPAGSLAELLDTLPLSGGAFVHATGTFGLYPSATPAVHQFYGRATAGYARRSEGLPWDGRIGAGPIPKIDADQIIDAIAEILSFGQPATQDAVAERLNITHSRSLQKMVKRVTRGTNRTWKDLQTEGARRARGLGRVQHETKELGSSRQQEVSIEAP